MYTVKSENSLGRNTKNKRPVTASQTPVSYTPWIACYEKRGLFSTPRRIIETPYVRQDLAPQEAVQ